MDLCMNCGKKLESELWGAECNCNEPDVVHLRSCDRCRNLVGIIVDDDYCVAEKIYCSECVKKVEGYEL